MKKLSLSLRCLMVILALGPTLVFAQMEWTRAKLEGFVLEGVGTTYSGMLFYAPQYRISETLKVGAHLGYAPVRLYTQSVTSLLEGTIGAQYFFQSQWSAELSVGTQHWVGTRQDLGPTIGTVLNWHPGSFVSYVDTIRLGYSVVSQSSTFHMIRLGFGFVF